ncbi:hypothetical protein V8C43DRAFT_1927 [Trichoderma afarasin]
MFHLMTRRLIYCRIGRAFCSYLASERVFGASSIAGSKARGYEKDFGQWPRVISPYREKQKSRIFRYPTICTSLSNVELPSTMLPSLDSISKMAPRRKSSPRVYETRFQTICQTTRTFLSRAYHGTDSEPVRVANVSTCFGIAAPSDEIERTSKSIASCIKGIWNRKSRNLEKRRIQRERSVVASVLGLFRNTKKISAGFMNNPSSLRRQEIK